MRAQLLRPAALGAAVAPLAARWRRAQGRRRTVSPPAPTRTRAYSSTTAATSGAVAGSGLRRLRRAAARAAAMRRQHRRRAVRRAAQAGVQQSGSGDGAGDSVGGHSAEIVVVSELWRPASGATAVSNCRGAPPAASSASAGGLVHRGIRQGRGNARSAPRTLRPLPAPPHLRRRSRAVGTATARVLRSEGVQVSEASPTTPPMARHPRRRPLRAAQRWDRQRRRRDRQRREARVAPRKSRATVGRGRRGRRRNQRVPSQESGRRDQATTARTPPPAARDATPTGTAARAGHPPAAAAARASRRLAQS